MTTSTAPAAGSAGLGLPARIRSCLFDLDGVLTRTADQHARAWKEMFDAFLLERAHDTGLPRQSFDIDPDYLAFVDGKSRRDGTRSFLASRGITLLEGSPGDGPEVHSVYGLSNRKNARVLELIALEGVTVFEESVRYVKAVRAAGLACAASRPTGPADSGWSSGSTGPVNVSNCGPTVPMSSSAN